MTHWLVRHVCTLDVQNNMLLATMSCAGSWLNDVILHSFEEALKVDMTSLICMCTCAWCLGHPLLSTAICVNGLDIVCTQCIVLYLCVTVYANSVLCTYVLYCMYVLCMFVYIMFHMCIVCVCLCMYVCMYVRGVYIYTCVCVCMHTCTHSAYIYVRMYIWCPLLASTAASLHAFVPCALIMFTVIVSSQWLTFCRVLPFPVSIRQCLASLSLYMEVAIVDWAR